MPALLFAFFWRWLQVHSLFFKSFKRVVVGDTGFRILMLADETFGSESQIHAVELNSLLG